MGQPKVASVTWRDRIRRISQGFYETMGQQIPQTRASEPMRAWSHVKILNRDLRSTVIFLRKPKGISQTFRLRGRHCKNDPLNQIDRDGRQLQWILKKCFGGAIRNNGSQLGGPY